MAKANIHKVTTGEHIEIASAGHGFEDRTKIIEVTVSERNLLSLLAKLYIEGSKRTIYNGDVPEGYVLKLVAEDDEAHYSSESREGAAAGVMHPATEELVEILKKTLRHHESQTKVAHLFTKSVKQARGESSLEKLEQE